MVHKDDLKTCQKWFIYGQHVTIISLHETEFTFSQNIELCNILQEHKISISILGYEA